jgi:N-acetylmuramoyl-L-alanine amidase
LYAFYSSRQNTDKGVMNMKKAVFFIVLTLLTSTTTVLAAPPEATVEEEVIQAYVQKASEICNWKAEDIELLARVIHGEARGEKMQGKIAVGAVVLNRVESQQFPNTLTEVIFQPNAFTCVQDGQIHLTPDLSSYQAALEAILGNDPTQGSLFYYNPRTATSRWIRDRKIVHVIGNHVFTE